MNHPFLRSPGVQIHTVPMSGETICRDVISSPPPLQQVLRGCRHLQAGVCPQTWSSWPVTKTERQRRIPRALASGVLRVAQVHAAAQVPCPRVAVEHELFQLPRWMSSIGHPRGTRHDPAMRHIGRACIQQGTSSMCDLCMGFAQQILASARYSRAYLVLDPTTVPMRRPAAFEQRSARGVAAALQMQIVARHSQSEIRHPRDNEEKWDHLGLIMSHLSASGVCSPCVAKGRGSRFSGERLSHRQTHA